jgi:hypothetical protein
MMHRENAKSEKEKIKFERMQEDHKKLLYPTAEEGQKSWVPHWNCCNGRQRMVYPTRIWAVTGYPKEDASEGKRIARHYLQSKISRLPSRIRNPEDTCMS